MPVACPRCGGKVPEGAPTCFGCGCRISEEAAPKQTSPSEPAPTVSPDDLTCFYCGTYRAETAAEVVVPLHMTVKQESESLGPYARHTFHYKEHSIAVPRCGRCREVHGKYRHAMPLSVAYGISTVLFALAVVALATGSAGDSNELVRTLLLFILPAGGGLFVLIGGHVDHARQTSITRQMSAWGIKPTWERDCLKHPEVVRLRNEGWSLGINPTTPSPY